MVYLLDANAFIEAKKRWYGFDICPGYWDWLDEAHSRGDICSIEAVRAELLAKNDDLSSWARQRAQDFFLPSDGSDLAARQDLARWVQAQRYTPAAIAHFLASADYALIALAKTQGLTVVSLEEPSTARRKVKIPEPCAAFGVAWISPFDLLRRSGVRFIR